MNLYVYDAPQILGELNEIFQFFFFFFLFFYNLFEIPGEIFVTVIKDVLASLADSPADSPG